MDSGQCEALASRLSAHLTRRRSLGVFGALGVAGANVGLDADARQKKKKRKKAAQTTTAAPVTTPAPLVCPDGQKACHGACIDAARCCANGDCALGQECAASGLCICGAGTAACGALCCIQATQFCYKPQGKPAHCAPR